jgi:hypothetical protein
MSKDGTGKGLCPRCGKEWDKTRAMEGMYPALSRRDNKTAICSGCGTAEAFEDMGMTKYTGPIYWKEPHG